MTHTYCRGAKVITIFTVKCSNIESVTALYTNTCWDLCIVEYYCSNIWINISIFSYNITEICGYAQKVELIPYVHFRQELILDLKTSFNRLLILQFLMNCIIMLSDHHMTCCLTSHVTTT